MKSPNHCRHHRDTYDADDADGSFRHPSGFFQQSRHLVFNHADAYGVAVNRLLRLSDSYSAGNLPLLYAYNAR